MQLSDGLKPERSANGIFTRYRVQLPERQVAVSYSPCDTDVPPMAAELADAPQPGPQYDMEYRPLPGSRNWRLGIPSDALTGLNNVFLQFDVTGDTAALYLNDKLVDDWFIFGPPMTVGLKHFAEALKKRRVQTATHAIDREAEYLSGRSGHENPRAASRNKGITVLPEYEVTVQAEK